MSGNARLRLSKDIVLSSELKHTLSNIMGEFEVFELNDLPDYQRSFSTQLNKFKDSFVLLIESYPPDKQGVKVNIDNIKELAEQFFKESEKKLKHLAPDEKFDAYQDVLVEFTQRLLNIIDSRWEEDNPKELTEYLNLAEQYWTSQNGRQDLATLSKINVDGESFIVLLHEKVISPCNPVFAQEVLAIKEAGLKELPNWYKNLSPAIQGLITYFDESECSIKGLRQSLRSISNQLNHSENLQADLEAIQSDKAKLPLWFEKLDKAQQVFVRRTLRNSGVSVDVFFEQLNSSLNQVNNLNDIKDIGVSLNKVYRLPEWYQSMSHVEHHMFYNKIKELDSVQAVEEAFVFLSSKDRTKPLPSNFAIHTKSVLSGDGEILQKGVPKIRSSHIASRDVMHQSIEAQDRHPADNIKKIVEQSIGFVIEKHQARFGVKPKKIPLLLQTLISPIEFLGSVIPDPYLNAKKIKAVKNLPQYYDGIKINPFYPNHPFNYARYWEYTGNTFFNLTTSDEQCFELLSYVDDYLKEVTDSLLRAAHFKLAGKIYDEQGLKNYINKIVNERITYPSELTAFEIEKLMSAVQKLKSEETFDEFQSSCMAVKIIDILQGKASVDSILDDVGFREISRFPRDKAEKAKEIIQIICDDLSEHASVLQSNTDHLGGFLCQELITKLSPNQLAGDYKHAVDEHLGDMLDEYKKLTLLREAYQATLESEMGTATVYDYNGRELFLSSCEQLIFDVIGMSQGSCVSGKDREAIEKIHSDAMDLFYLKYKRFPKFSDETDSIDRQIFVDIVAQIYLTRHHIEHAGDNSPGSDGIKTPGMYFPRDVCERINSLASAKYFEKYVRDLVERELKAKPNSDEFVAYMELDAFTETEKKKLMDYLNQFEFSNEVKEKLSKWNDFILTNDDDDIATNNELRRIGMPQAPSVSNFWNLFGMLSSRERFSIDGRVENYYLKAKGIDEPKRRALLNIIEETCKQNEFWKEKLSYASSWFSEKPSHIGKIENIINQGPKDTARTLAEIYKVLDDKDNSHKSRDKFTENFYQLIMSVYDAEDPNQIVDFVIARLKKVKLHMTGELKLQQASKITEETRQQLCYLIHTTTGIPNDVWGKTLPFWKLGSSSPTAVGNIHALSSSTRIDTYGSEQVLADVFDELLKAGESNYGRSDLTLGYYTNLLNVYYSDEPQKAAEAAIKYLNQFQKHAYPSTQSERVEATL